MERMLRRSAATIYIILIRRSPNKGTLFLTSTNFEQPPPFSFNFLLIKSCSPSTFRYLAQSGFYRRRLLQLRESPLIVTAELMLPLPTTWATAKAVHPSKAANSNQHGTARAHKAEWKKHERSARVFAPSAEAQAARETTSAFSA